MAATVPSTPVGFGASPLRLLHKGPEYFRGSKGSGNKSQRQTAAERLEADKFKYVKSEEVRQRRFTLELRTGSPPNNDSTGTQSMGTASTGSPINMEEDDDITAANDVTGDFTSDGIIQSMANVTRYKEVKPQQNTPVSSKHINRKPTARPPAGISKPDGDSQTNAELLHNITSTRRQQRMKNKALRSGEKELSRQKNLDNNIPPPSPLITRLREKLGNSSGSHNIGPGNAYTPTPIVASTAEEVSHKTQNSMKTSDTDKKNKDVASTKSTSGSNALNTYFNKAKEGLKSVASLKGIIGSDKVDGIDHGKERQSRSLAANNGRRYRSASAGPNVGKSLCPNVRASGSVDAGIRSNTDPSGVADPVMSPRSQLKHVRKNLKKVKIGPTRSYGRKHTNSETSAGFDSTGSPGRISGTTFAVNPSAEQKIQPIKSSENPALTTELKASKEEPNLDSKPPLIPRPKARENVNKSTGSSSRTSDSAKRRTSSSSSGKEENGSLQDVENADPNSNPRKGASVRRINSARVKRRSWDFAHAMDNSVQTSSRSGDDNTPPSSSAGMDVTNVQSSNGGLRQRKHSRGQTTDTKKSNLSSRMSLPEDVMQPFRDANPHLLQKTGSRKSVAEALEEIISPVFQNVDDNRNSNASPSVGSMDDKTLVANRESYYGDLSTMANFGDGSVSSRNAIQKNVSVADNINFVLGGAIDETWEGKVSDSSENQRNSQPPSCSSKSRDAKPKLSEEPSPPYTRSKAAAMRSLKSKDSSMDKLSSSGQHSNSANSSNPLSFFHGPNNSGHLRPVPLRQHSAPTGAVNSRPTSRIDLPPQSNAGTDDGVLSGSPMLAPKSRKEVVPECNRSSRQPKTSTEGVNTMKSQASSASGDANKPFTALTASDLKPRSNRNLRSIHPASTPVRPVFAFPGHPAPQNRHNPKRHTTTPVSPTLSPNKQVARMTPPQTPTRSCSSTPYSSLKRTPTSSRNSSLKRNRHRSKSEVLSCQPELDRFFSSMGMEDYMTLTHHSSANDTLYSNHLSSESDFSFAGASAYVRDSPDEAMDVDPISAPLIRGPQSVSIIEKNARVMKWLMSCQKNRKQQHSAAKPRSPSAGEFVATHSPPVSPGVVHTREPLKPSHQLLSTYPPAAAPIAQNGHAGHRRSGHYYLRQSSQPVGYTQTPPTNNYPSSPPPIPPRTYQRQQGGYTSPHGDAILVGAPKESNV